MNAALNPMQAALATKAMNAMTTARKAAAGLGLQQAKSQENGDS